jgi:hypothetical protein
LSDSHNPSGFRTTIRAVVTAAFALSCTDTVAPSLDRIVAIQIRAEPDVDTVRLADSITFTVWADTLTPSSVTWILEPAADTIVAASLVYRPSTAGATLVRAVADFPEERVGLADRRVVTPTNRPPSGTIEFAEPGNYTRVPLGDTLVMVAAFTDPDDEPFVVRWLTTTSDASGGSLLGIGDTLRLPTDTVGLYVVTAEARDHSGARGMAVSAVAVYDPITPSAWRIYVGSLDQLTATDDGSIIARCSGSEYAGPFAPHVVFDAAGQATQTVTDDCGPPPSPSIDGASYAVDNGGTLRRISRTGVVEWTLADVSLGPIVLPDSSLVVRSSTGASAGIRLRRVTSSGTVLWDRTLDDSLWWVENEVNAVVGSDSAIYAVARTQAQQFLLRVAPDGNEQWRIPLWDDRLSVADDSTILAVGVALTAIRPDGTIRWTRELPAGAAFGTRVLVGGGDLGYTSWTDAGTVTLLTFRTTDGADVREFTGDWSGDARPVALAADGTVIYSIGTLLIGVDATTGTERWRHATAGYSGVGMVLTDAGLLVVPNNGYLEAVDLGVGPLDSPWPMAWGGNRRLGRRQTP